MITAEVVDTLAVSIGAVTGAYAAVGVVLNKCGLLHFGRKTPSVTAEKCGLHNDLAKLVADVHTTQVTNLQRHSQHDKSLAAGEKRFDTLQEDVVELKEGVGILMDRSGGRPRNWKA